MYEVSVRDHFSAAHHLENYNGKCENQHGHNWYVEVYFRGLVLDEAGILIDFRVAKDVLADSLSILDHNDLNNIEYFKGRNPTSENIAEYLYHQISEKTNCERYSTHRVSVHETPGSIATYWGDK